MGTSVPPESPRSSANDIAELLQQTQSLIAAFAAQEEAARRSATELEAYAENAARAKAKDAKAAEQKAKADQNQAKAQDELTKANKKAQLIMEGAYSNMSSKLQALGRSFMDIADAGVKLAQSTGTSATKGMQLELANRTKVLSQIFTTDLNRMSSDADLVASQQAVADAFVGIRDGMQMSSDGVQAFNAQLKGGFRSEFQLTGQSLRALTVIGATTEGQMDAFRRATGRASLSSSQLSNIVNKNTLSFLLYGNKFAKAATQAEMMGISLESIQSAQKGLVTNLDSTIDTVAQLNQLGAQVDFGELVRIAEQEGPDALLRYVQSTVPEGLMKSTSFRSLFEQLGISSETLLRANQVGKSSESLQAKFEEGAKEAGLLAKGFTAIQRSGMVVSGSFGGLFLATVLAIGSMIAFARAGGGFNAALQLFTKNLIGSSSKIGASAALTATTTSTAATSVANTARRTSALPRSLQTTAPAVATTTSTAATSVANTARRTSALPRSLQTTAPAVATSTSTGTTFNKPTLAGGARASAGMGAIAGLVSGYMEYKQSGSIKKALGRGLANIAGAMIGGALGSFIPIPFVGTMIGSSLGAWAANWLFDKLVTADDLMSGYGSRTLLTSSGAYALNNRDTVIAGTNLFRGNDVTSFGEGALSLGNLVTNPLGALVNVLSKNTGTTKSSELEKKIDALITTIQNANMVININDTKTQTNRMAVVSVQTTRGGQA